MSLRIWKPSQLVNTTTTNLQEDPDVSVLSDGRFVVVWTDRSTDDTRIMAQLYETDGTKTGSEFPVAQRTGEDARNADVTAVDGGGFVVLTYFATPGDAPARVYSFDGDGNEVDQAWSYSTSPKPHWLAGSSSGG